MQLLSLESLASLLFLSILPITASSLLVSAPGYASVIPSWKVQSSIKVGNDATKLSALGLNVSDWYTIGPKGTLMATLLENHRLDEDDIFYSDKLTEIDLAQFRKSAFYRTEFELSAEKGTYFQLKTHGISSRADIYLNGALITDKSVQAGAYTGLMYDLTSKAENGTNVLLVRVYPTDYNRDFALGFVDWNPYPPDNGTGIWRDVEIKETGTLCFTGTPRVNTEILLWNGTRNARVSVRVDMKNLEKKSVQGDVVCSVVDYKGKEKWMAKTDVNIGADAMQKVSLDFTIGSPALWYPKQWGAQPLYSTSCKITIGGQLSDSTPDVRFGIRTVTSSLNKFNDTTFFVNGEPFQVLGAGYSSDIFLRFDEEKLRAQFQYVADIGLNTVRLEGKQEHARLYELADEMGIMIMAGWECCDKWEGWSYNEDGSGEKWKGADYAIANASMRHEAELMQHHPSMLCFLVGSDVWPDDRATQIWVNAMKAFDFDVPIIASASQRGFPALLGNSGMKMVGPYDWVPPNYWYTNQRGAALGFGSELGSGVGTPELSSLKRFLSPSDLDDLWKHPTKGLYHMSTNVSSFYTRTIYNGALWARYGPPTSLEDYLLKAQMMDYEATRAEFEAYAAKWTAERPATGLIYWMLNSAWPSLHWNLFDYYLHPAGAYFGSKTGSRPLHVAYDYLTHSVYLINRFLSSLGPCTVNVELLDLNGTVISNTQTTTQLSPNYSTQLFQIQYIDEIRDVALLKLVLKSEDKVLSRNVYHLTPQLDELDFDNSTWFYTPVTKYADFKALNELPQVDLSVKAAVTKTDFSNITMKIKLCNRSNVPAVFIRLNLVYANRTYVEDAVPVRWSDNYVTLWPNEELGLEVRFTYDAPNKGWSDWATMVQVDGWNVGKQTIDVNVRRGGKES